MKIQQLETNVSLQPWPPQEILAAMNALALADDSNIARLLAQRAYLLLPDTELSLEVRHLVSQLRNNGRIEQIANCFEKIPFSRVGQAWEGYVVYATSLFISLGLLQYTTRCYSGRLRCALFMEQAGSSHASSPTWWEKG